MNTLFLANLAAAAAAISAGACVVATRFVIAETDPVALAFFRNVIAATCMFPVLLTLWPKVPPLTVRELSKIAALGALFFGLFTWAFSAALQYTPAARGAIGLATIPIQTLIIASLFGRESLSPRKILSVILAFIGVASVFGPKALAAGSASLVGDALMLLGGLSAAIYSVFSRPVLGRNGPIFVTAMAMIFGVLALSPFAVASGAVNGIPVFTREGWLSLLFLGTVGGALQFSLFIWALRWLPPTRTVIYLTLNPMSAVILAVLLLGEALTVELLVGLVIVLCGILVANLPQKAEAK